MSGMTPLLALTFHELATNVAKYGALAATDGSVSIVCTIENDHACILWIERGGAVVHEPSDYGFGSKLIDLSVMRQMGGLKRPGFSGGSLVWGRQLYRGSLWLDSSLPRPLREEW